MTEHEALKPPLGLDSSFITSATEANLFMERPTRFPTELIPNMGVFTEAGFQLETIDQLEESKIRDIVERPEEKHLFVAIGEPGSGKTLIEQQILADMLFGRDEIYKFTKNTNRKVVVDKFPWGMAFDAIPEDERENGDYHENPHLRKYKILEIEKAERNFLRLISDWARAPHVEGIINIAYADVPGITGTYFDDTRPIGIPRGHATIQDIMGPRGAFADVPLNVHVIGVSASPEVRQFARENRQIQASEDIKEALRQLADRGFISDPADVKSFEEYNAEVAPPDQITLCERDTDQVIEAMSNAGLLHIDDLDKIKSDSDILWWQHKRYQVIGQELIPKFMREVCKIPEDRGIVLNSRLLISTVHAYLNIASGEPIIFESR